ncbi:MAG TPA: hypothetical protein VME44_09475 [Streptosporangiaceae bacterium]|nr:hypothetical protein [Streptosporangiaceae bacterium]
MTRDIATRQDGRRAASDYLQQLLLTPGSYRQAWEQYASRERRGTINQLAVAEVIARHLWLTPRGPGDVEITPHQLKDTVSRALTGRLLSRSALSLFISAFGFSEHEAARLWRLWNGAVPISVMSGTHAVSARAEEDVDRVLGPRRHHTLSLHEHVYVGADGRIDRARTMQVIEAIAQGVDRIPVLVDSNVLTLEVRQGGKELGREVHQIADGVFGTEILLARSLELGETLTLEYWLTYRYPGDPADAAERRFRLAVTRQVENVDMRVEFHPDRLPSELWWAQWDGVDGDVIEREAATLDRQFSAHRYLRSVEKTVAGVYWRWNTG